MKKTILLSLFALSASLLQTAAAQDMATAPNTEGTAKIVFIRATGHPGSATAFTTFIDDNLVCRLNNKRFSTHSVAPGEHTISVQFAGKESKEKAERIKINTDAGKTYYVQLIIQQGLWMNNVFCQEVTENSANLLLPKLKEDTKCL